MIASRTTVACQKYYGKANSFGTADTVSRAAVLQYKGWAVRLFNGYQR